MNLRPKLRQRLVREKTVVLTVPTQSNGVRSMNFMHDLLADGCCIRLFNVTTTSTVKGCVLRWISRCRQNGDPSAGSGHRVAWCAEDNPLRQRPRIYQAVTLAWAERSCIKIDFIQQDNPQQSAYVAPQPHGAL